MERDESTESDAFAGNNADARADGNTGADANLNTDARSESDGAANTCANADSYADSVATAFRNAIGNTDSEACSVEWSAQFSSASRHACFVECSLSDARSSMPVRFWHDLYSKLFHFIRLFSA